MPRPSFSLKTSLLVLSLVTSSLAQGHRYYGLEETAAWAKLIAIVTVQKISIYNRTYVDTPYPSDPEKEVTTVSLFSHYELEVERVLKGKISTNQITVNIPGGFDGRYWSRLGHSATLVIGRKYLLMAVPSNIFPLEWVVANGASGAIELTEKDGEFILGGSEDGIEDEQGINPPKGVKLSEFEALIKDQD